MKFRKSFIDAISRMNRKGNKYRRGPVVEFYYNMSSGTWVYHISDGYGQSALKRHPVTRDPYFNACSGDDLDEYGNELMEYSNEGVVSFNISDVVLSISEDLKDSLHQFEQRVHGIE